MKILHTADLHLGSPLLASRDQVRAAADGVLERIVTLALTEAVDALVIAGDMLDRNVADLTLRARLARQLNRAAQGGVPVVMIKGNHDALMDYDSAAPMGEGIHLLTRASPSVRLGEAMFHGLGFEGRFQTTSLLPDYPAPIAGKLNIGLMHTSLSGSPGRDPYAPVAPGDLILHGYDYWALGHVHQRMEIVQDNVALVMAGIPQGRDAGEPGRGSVTIATLGATRSLTEVPIAEVIFETRDLDLTGLDQGQIIEAFQKAAPQGGPYHMMRYRVSGTDLPLSALEAYAAEALDDHDSASFEAVRLGAARHFADPDGLLQLAQEGVTSDSYQDEATRLLADWQAALPRELRRDFGPEALTHLTEDALAELAAVLRGQAG